MTYSQDLSEFPQEPLVPTLGDPDFHFDFDPFVEHSVASPISKGSFTPPLASPFLSPLPSPGPLPDDELFQPPKKKPRTSPQADPKKERNKAAAQKYRQKLKSEAATTESRFNELTKENTNLAIMIQTEKAKIADMRLLLIKHGILKA